MNVKILVFLHGTSIMHKNAKGLSREEAIKQVMAGDESLHDYASYIPVGNAAKKLRVWKGQGTRICYLSPHRNAEDVVERIRPLPDVIVEDDCQSLGGEVEMVYPNLRQELKNKIKSIVVKEFGGIDYLPGQISELLKYN